MVRHRWEVREQSQSAPARLATRVRARVGRGALLCLLFGALAWIAVSLLFHPLAGPGGLLGRVELEPSAATEEGRDGAADTGSGPNLDAGAGADTEPDADAGARAAGSGESAGAGTATSAAPASGEAGTVVVHVAGEVEDPGVYTFPAGTRGATAVEAAGGMTTTAEPSAVNLAAPLQDGQQLLIPAQGTAPARAAPAAPGAAPPAGGGGPVDVNRASSAELETLPGIGPALAGRIIEFRERNGPFASIAELDAVSGIGPAMMGRLEGLVVFG
ncbi:ComEA family DNA-binding protein [Zafaria sp. J156]|uniref:ComEA family DNA-binding protein n=1 Tax=Zafaria sp. J156 TaxID=3116490 RepID=UPI002E775930|nr:ComEA family DNA-binding protein [Zafaria sp. J156]MEE1621147.1 ComEA family DNA-binding protein [Zafaria sp. J156]